MKCVVLSPERELFEGDVSAVQLPAHDGGVGVFPGHAPLIGALGDGFLVLKAPQGEKTFLVFGGFYRVLGDVVTILSAEAMPAEDMTPERARAEAERAQAFPAHTDEDVHARARAWRRARLARRAAEQR